MFSFVPASCDEHTTFIHSSSSNTAAGYPIDFVAWSKPPGIKMIWILAVSPGGAGGLGLSGSINGGKSGAGGGGSGGAMSFIFSAANFPDTVFFAPGSGGVSGGANGTIATCSIVEPFNTATVGWQIYTINPGAPGGGATSGITPGAGGAGGTYPGTDYFSLGAIYRSANAVSESGTAGTTSGGVVSNSTPFTTSFFAAATGSGGNASGGPLYLPGSIIGSTGTFINFFPDRLGGQNASDPGLDGMLVNNNMQPIMIYGGTGGADAWPNNLAAGNGGNGIYGSGGGGGGPGAQNPAPTGGRGGNGFVLIKCW